MQKFFLALTSAIDTDGLPGKGGNSPNKAEKISFFDIKPAFSFLYKSLYTF